MERQQAREDLDRLWGDYKIIQRDEVLWGLEEEEEEDAGYFFVDSDDTFCFRQLFGMEPYPEVVHFGTEKWD